MNMNQDIINFVILPLLIFTARIFDVTIGTMRIILVARGKKAIAPLLGFFEVLIWIIAISQIMENLSNWVTFIAYAAGFATGNYVGMLLEEKLAMGIVGVRIITAKSADNLIGMLKDQGYSLTYTEAHGREEEVHIIFITIKRTKLKKLISLIHEFNPKAFFTIEDIKYANVGYTYNAKKHKSIFRLRKGK
jgi:uncharacterized protein YebE (UPF0316 family)